MAKKIIFHSTNRSDFSYIKNIIIKLAIKNKIFVIFYNDNKSEYLNLKKKYLTNLNIKIFFFNKIKTTSVNIFKLNQKIGADFNFVVGDRKEMVLPTLISHNMKIPVLHLGGGEATKNSPDDNYRQIISMLSSYHFCSTIYAKKRLNKMGIDKNIKIVGATSYEELSKFDLSKSKNILNKYKLVENKYILFNFHSESFDLNKEIKLIKYTLRRLSEHNFKIIITSSNKDFNGNKLNTYYKKKRNNKLIYIDSIGSEFYKYFLFNCKFMIGNSSSGIIESIFFKKLNISIGNRQIGRDHDNNTLFLSYDFKKINTILKNIESKIRLPLEIKYVYKKYNSSSVISKTLDKF